MKHASKFLNTVTIVSCVVLAASYFLPAEGCWAPSNAWLGYYVGGEFVSGLNVGLVEVFPYGVGLIVLAAVALERRPGASTVVMGVFASAWIVSLTWEVARIAMSGAYAFGALWLTLAAVIIPAVLVACLVCLRRFEGTNRVAAFAAILAASSILQQSCSIAWYLFEERLLLNVGSVTGAASGVGLFVSLVCISLVK